MAIAITPIIVKRTDANAMTTSINSNLKMMVMRVDMMFASGSSGFQNVHLLLSKILLILVSYFEHCVQVNHRLAFKLVAILFSSHFISLKLL